MSGSDEQCSWLGEPDDRRDPSAGHFSLCDTSLESGANLSRKLQVRLKSVTWLWPEGSRQPARLSDPASKLPSLSPPGLLWARAR